MGGGKEARRGDVLLSGEGLVRRYDDATVVDVDSIEVRTGEVLAVLGPNGAGKSTLLRLLAALEAPEDGRLLYRGRAVGRDDPELRRTVAAVLQRPYLWRGTVAGNVEFALKARRLSASERRERVRQALQMVDIVDLADVPVDTLSGGEAQRVALARALAVEPEILFLDEPTADLDVSVRRRLLGDLERIVRHAAPAIVLVTHDPGEAFALADRVVVMEGGRIVQAGTPAEIFESPATEFVASFTGAEFMLNGTVSKVDEGTMTVRLESGASLEAAGSAEPGARVRVGYRPEDVVVSLPQSSSTSARNRFDTTVAHLHPRGGLVRLRLEADSLSLEAVITRHAMEELGLQVGTSVVAQVKATALHVFPA
ncbi:MAG: ABC transporter ATP-binding protein [Gemmatimonadetes bacterium]|uniref:ABC transporter ATP-binding protein n=1 Tax=Candidatus Kutchimonas denitrificans TaxID=3056748 RepID=A0AAE5CC20_9BACT|nr:ABC transporter ATP-binding protein [Gemmatimonadota bacterium]NIR75120.1 ABC transporter ATP-binding protein [Candidatus Kutchimonas denitrificans]NIS00952.1 ABC transporter ATP-binding protein [Gemmatimonadota bacterium]NIT66569.1 ABC transporter ATP-binding protein [Gemmatimonadota bacterium]NIU52915.1 ATP-binding cassette domain-containing protein [Gemmatimonadota bacterium]